VADKNRKTQTQKLHFLYILCVPEEEVFIWNSNTDRYTHNPLSQERGQLEQADPIWYKPLPSKLPDGP